jgi:hypothetical protein
MPNEFENDNSETVEEETPETTTEVLDPAEDILAKNAQIYERAKKAELKVKELEQHLQTTETFEDEDDLRLTVKELSQKLSRMEEKTQFESLYNQYPILKDKVAEFDEYRSSNPGMSLETGAKAFLAEHDLFGQVQKRKGLEKAGGGQRTPPTSKMTSDDAKRLRETNYAEYKKQLVAGKIQF